MDQRSPRHGKRLVGREAVQHRVHRLASGVDVTATDPITGLPVDSGTTADGQVALDIVTTGDMVTLTATAPRWL